LDEQRNQEIPQNPVPNHLELEAREKALRKRRLKQIADGIGVGLTFIFIGVVWLLVRFGYLNVSLIRAIVDLWPLIFVVIGVNIIFRRVPFVGLITWVLFLASLLWYGSVVGSGGRNFDFFGMTIPGWNFTQESRGSSTWTFNGTTTGSFDRDDLEGLNRAKFNITMPAGSLNIGMTDQSALTYEVPSRLYDIDTSRDSGSVSFNFKTQTNLKFNNMNERLNHEIRLNPEVPWDLRIDVGAMESQLNLETIPVESIVINMGAGEIDLNMGGLVNRAKVEMNCGATSIRMTAPDHVGISVDYKGLISDHSLLNSGFVKENGVYYSPGYNQTQQRIELSVKSAVAEIDFRFR
jgi:hypothetical protein